MKMKRRMQIQEGLRATKLYEVSQNVVICGKSDQSLFTPNSSDVGLWKYFSFAGWYQAINCFIHF